MKAKDSASAPTKPFPAQGEAAPKPASVMKDVRLDDDVQGDGAASVNVVILHWNEAAANRSAPITGACAVPSGGTTNPACARTYANG